MKLIVEESESVALQQFLHDHATDVRFSAALSRTELIRAVVRRGPVEIVEDARRLLDAVDTVAMTSRLLDEAAAIRPSDLRTLDAIHLASALTAPALRALITYDSRLAAAATSQGITVVAPR
ncbi:type II toxin-antitoxin system VapC family toxin [Sulfuricaulis sp.]|uniref:type II toxin-antitoxin system VapC family toxin n=1 Tax=Sulfuricaulis sp. TaxID=2003553 RepID=UPI003C740857